MSFRLKEPLLRKSTSSDKAGKLSIPLLEVGETNKPFPSTELHSTKSSEPVSPERKTVLFSRPHSLRLFDKKLDGVQAESPQEIKEAYRELHQAIRAIYQLPHSIRMQLDLTKLGKFDFKTIHQELDEVIADEACCRRLKGAWLGIGLVVGVSLALRSLVSAMYYIISSVTPIPLLTPPQVAQWGWEISKWPAMIFGGASSCLGTAFGCTKGNTEIQLMALQKLIDEAVDKIQRLELAIKIARGDERIEQETPTVGPVRAAIR